MTKITLAVMLAAGPAAPTVRTVLPAPSLLPNAVVTPALPSARPPLAAVWAQAAEVSVANAVDEPASAMESATPIPSWFDARGLSYVLLRQDPNGLTMALLRRGRYELLVYLDGNAVATFTKHALNPMGTPQRVDVGLQDPAARRAVADILRRAPAPSGARERAVLEAVLRALS